MLRKEIVSFYITKTSPCNEHPPYTPLLYSKTGGYRGILCFLIFSPKHRLWVLVRTASLRRFLRVPTINVLSKNKKKYYKLSSENNHFYSREILQYITRTCLRNDNVTIVLIMNRHHDEPTKIFSISIFFPFFIVQSSH